VLMPGASPGWYKKPEALTQVPDVTGRGAGRWI
jgi:hypothetical protein